MSDNDNDLMGYDPLEWLKGESNTLSPEPSGEPEQTSAPATEEVTDETLVESAVEPLESSNKTVTESSTASLINLESSLQIMDVALLKPRLLDSLNTQSPLTLQADADIVVDGAGIQLLLAFVQQAKADDIALRWEALPAPIAEAAKLLNTEQVMLLD